MRYLKSAPVGIDRPIQLLQSELYDRLLAAWGMADNDYEAYGRVYKNPDTSGNGYLPQPYIGAGEYKKDALLEDKFSVVSFFGMADKMKVELKTNLAQVHFICFINLEKVQSVPERGDEEARLEMRAVHENPFGFTLNEVVTGIPSIFPEYSVSKKGNGNKFDLHPFHACRFNLSLRYFIEE